MNINIDKTEALYLHNDSLKDTLEAKINLPDNTKILYEVIRIIDGKPLFLNEHINRLQQSLILSDIEGFKKEQVIEGLLKLLQANYVQEKNLKINLYNNKGEQELFAYFIESHYPNEQAYKYGVKVELLPIERHNPNIKLENPTLRGSADKAICLSQTHEMLLVNANGFITEGSRSNFFAILGESLVTPPAQQVLEGVTRKMVIQLANENAIKLIERPIHSSEIHEMNGAFITGTSPKVLPIARIGDHSFTSFPETITRMMELYDQLVDKRIHIQDY